MENSMENSELLKLNMNGNPYVVERRSLARYPHSRLALLADISPSYHAATGHHHLTGQASLLPAILVAYSGSHVRFSRDTHALEALEQLEYWGLPVSVLEPGLRHRYQEELTCAAGLAGVSHDVPAGWQGTLYRFLEMPRSSVMAMLWASACHVLALVSVLILMAKTVVEPPDYTSMESYTRSSLPDLMHPNLGFLAVEVPITLLLLAEHVMLCIATSFKGTLWSFFNVMAMLGVYPALLSYMLLLGGYSAWDRSHFVVFAILLHCSPLCRLFRFVKGLRCFLSMRVLLCTLAASWRQLLAWLICVAVGMVLFGSLLFFLELTSDYYRVDNAGQGLWWSLTTLTTVGYGDIYPVTVQSKVLASMCMLCGVITIAMTTAIVTSQLLYLQELAREMAIGESGNEGAMQARLQRCKTALESAPQVTNCALAVAKCEENA